MHNVIYVLIETEHDRMGSFSHTLDWDESEQELEKRKQKHEENAPRICEYRIEKVHKDGST